MKVDGIGIFQECLNMVRTIYQDKHTNEHTKHIIIFELRRLMPNHDIMEFLNESS